MAPPRGSFRRGSNMRGRGNIQPPRRDRLRRETVSQCNPTQVIKVRSEVRAEQTQVKLQQRGSTAPQRLTRSRRDVATGRRSCTTPDMAPPRGSFRRGSNMRGRGNIQPPRRDRLRRERVGNEEIPTIQKRLLKMIVSSLQPLEITEHTDFLEFAKALSPSLQIPRRSVIRSQLLGIYNEKENELRSILGSADHIVLTCELWSSRAEDSYLTVGCHFVDIHGSLQSYMLKTTSLFGDESAANIQNQLSAVMEAWGVKEKVHCVVRAGMPQLKKVKKEWTDMPCFADTLNVVFKDLMNGEELSNVLRKCQNIVRFFKYDSEAERKLREFQSLLKMEQDEVIMYSGDRWLPWLDMLKRLIEQRKAVMMVLADRGKTDLILNEDDLQKINNIIKTLEPLKNATSRMETEGFKTISAILPLLKRLMGDLKEEKRRNNVARTLLSKCRNKFGDVDDHWLALTTFLDPRFKNQLGDKNKRRAKQKIMEELTPGRASSSAKLKDLLNRYMAYEPTAERSNPLAWWMHTGKKDFGELSKLALKKLGVVSTAVPLERAFSSAGDRFCSLRSAIDPENLNMILFLNSNWSTQSETQIY